LAVEATVVAPLWGRSGVSGFVGSYQLLLLSGDEIEQCEAALFGCLVEADEMVLGGGDEVRGLVSEQFEEFAAPESSLKWDAAEGSALGDGESEILKLVAIAGEAVEFFQFALDPVLVLALRELKELLGSAFELDLILEVANELCEVAVGVAMVDLAVLELGGEDSGAWRRG
jgi:hypothetical protein